MSEKAFMFIAGDPSGDVHASKVVAELVSRDPGCTLTGIGGPAMTAEGFTSLFPFEPFNKMGYIEVLRHLLFFLSAKKRMIGYLKEIQPACLVCVDYSGFNIPMMKAAEKTGIPVIWYITPMVWAWKKKRAEVLARYASYICCIFPFEVPYFTPFTEHVSFVGNPLVEAFLQKNNAITKRATLPDSPVIALIPGSRPQEIARITEPMIAAYSLLKKKFPDLSAVLSRYKTLPEDIFDHYIEGTDITLSDQPLTELLKRADLAVVTSGTATLETALMGIPHVIVYKTSPLTFSVFKHFVEINYIGLPNIISGEALVPECLQQDVNPENISRQIEPFISDPKLYESTCNKLLTLKETLSSKKASSNVADVIFRYSR
jgi:lipid-A-disaccharide synthase